MRGQLRGSGFVRSIDGLGRVVLPVEWRRTFAVGPGDPMEIIPGGDGTLILKRYVPSGTCTFCAQTEGIRHFAGRPVCRTCLTEMGHLARAE